MEQDKSTNQPHENENENKTSGADDKQPATDKEVGGPKGPEPTRYGDWEKNGRCIDF